MQENVLKSAFSLDSCDLSGLYKLFEMRHYEKEISLSDSSQTTHGKGSRVGNTWLLKRGHEPKCLGISALISAAVLILK